jgi:hypothetical protein
MSSGRLSKVCVPVHGDGGVTVTIRAPASNQGAAPIVMLVDSVEHPRLPIVQVLDHVANGCLGHLQYLGKVAVALRHLLSPSGFTPNKGSYDNLAGQRKGSQGPWCRRP